MTRAPSARTIPLLALVLGLTVATGTALASCASTAGQGGKGVQGGLELRMEADHATRAEGEELRAEALFVNTSGEHRRFHVPAHQGLVPFPQWTMVRQDGRRFVPQIPSFQTGWLNGGILGELVELGPTETRRFEQRLRLFVPADADERSLEALTPLPLAPGRYRLECRYEKADATVPYAAEDFQVEHRLTEDLWTGTLDAAPLEFVVTPPNAPQLRIHAALEARRGAAYPIQVRLHNGGSTPLVLEHSLQLGFHRMGASAQAEIPVDRIPGSLPGADGARLELEPGATVQWSFDAATLPVRERSRRGAADPEAESPRLRFVDVMKRGLFYCELTVPDAEGAVRLRSNSIERFVASD